MAYKITNENLQSLIAKGCLLTKYKKDKWVKPSYGPSLVFLRKGDALEFINGFYQSCGVVEGGCGKCILWSCRTKGLRPAKVVLDLAIATKEMFRHFWDREDKLSIGLTLLMFSPRGTYAADEVMLTKEIP